MTDIKLYLGDCLEIMRTMKADAIITDPPYDWDHVFNPFIPDFIKATSGNIIAFCKPDNQYFGADEYLFWTKTPSTKNYSRNCGRFVEMILVKRSSAVFNQLHWSQMTGVYDDRLIYPPVHPHEKPVTLIERLIRIYTNPGDTILDPFMGSGTTGVACVQTGRNFIGIEISEEYFKIAERRIHDAQQQPSLLDTPKEG